MRQARQADVVVTVPDVAVLVFSSTAGSGEEEQVSKAFAAKSFQHCTQRMHVLLPGLQQKLTFIID